MAGSIKGLTVEIGGDTSKLGDALKRVDKQSRDLSSELGQINKLLKLDPGNTELLAQKQKILADAIENTKERLDTLRKAEKSVQEQFKQGKVSEAQVRALQREIIATEKKLNGYENALEETNRAMRGLDESTEKAEKSSQNFGETVGNIAKGGLKLLAAGVTATVGALVASAEASREYRAEMGKLETGFDAAGHSAETATRTYKILQGVIGETDQSVEAAQQIALLARSEEDAAKWAELAAGVVGRFGDALQPETFFEAANETFKLGESTAAYTQMLEQAGYSVDEFNKGLAACKTAEEQQAYMLRITDELLGEAADKYREVNGEVIRANEANEAWAAAMGEVGGAIEPILSDIKILGASLVQDLVPGVKQFADAFRGLMNGDDGAAADLGAALSGIFEQVLNKTVEMAPRLAEMGISLIASLAQSIVQALPQVLAAGGQIISQLLTGIATSLPGLAQSGLDMIGGLVNSIQTGLPQVLAKGSEILTNLTAGIAQGLPGLVSQGLDIIMNFATTLYDNAPTLIQTGFEMLSNLVSGIMSSLPTLIAKAPEIISKFANTINDNIPMILSKGVQLILQIVQGIISAIPTLVANIPKIIRAFVDAWSAFNWLNLGKTAIKALGNGIKSMVGTVKGAGTNILNSITNAIQSLPSKLLNMGKNGISSLGNAIGSGIGAVKSKAASIVSSIISSFTSLPGKMISVGKNIISGVISGIGSMVGALYNSITNALSGLVGKAKAALGIASPSKVFAKEVGAWIPGGVAVGTEKNMGKAEAAMVNMADDMVGAANAELGKKTLNGLTIQRQIQHTFTAPAAPTVESGMLAKLDSILAAIQKGQVLMLDGKALVGGTAKNMDSALGNRRILAGRGAL